MRSRHVDSARKRGDDASNNAERWRATGAALPRLEKKKEYWTSNVCVPRLGAEQAMKKLRLCEPPAPIAPQLRLITPPSPEGGGDTVNELPNCAVDLPDGRARRSHAERPRKRAKWTCLVDDDGSRRWVIQGSLAETRHREERGETFTHGSSSAAEEANTGGVNHHDAMMHDYMGSQSTGATEAPASPTLGHTVGDNEGGSARFWI